MCCEYLLVSHVFVIIIILIIVLEEKKRYKNIFRLFLVKYVYYLY